MMTESGGKGSVQKKIIASVYYCIWMILTVSFPVEIPAEGATLITTVKSGIQTPSAPLGKAHESPTTRIKTNNDADVPSVWGLLPLLYVYTGATGENGWVPVSCWTWNGNQMTSDSHIPHIKETCINEHFETWKCIQTAASSCACEALRGHVVTGHFNMPYKPFREISLTFPSRLKGLSPL